MEHEGGRARFGTLGRLGASYRARLAAEGVGIIEQEAYFRHLLDSYGKLAYSICYKMTGNRFDAEDLTQETFLAVYKALGSFREGHEKAWVCRIATNKCLDFLKSRGRRSEPADDAYFEGLQDGRASPEEQCLRREEEEGVYGLCLGLRSPYREVALAHFCHGKTAREIAEETGKGLKTVQTQIYRAKEMLKKLLEGKGSGNKGGGQDERK